MKCEICGGTDDVQAIETAHGRHWKAHRVCVSCRNGRNSIGVFRYAGSKVDREMVEDYEFNRDLVPGKQAKPEDGTARMLLQEMENREGAKRSLQERIEQLDRELEVLGQAMEIL